MAGELVPSQWTSISALEVAGAFERVLGSKEAALLLLMYWSLTTGKSDMCVDFNIFDHPAEEGFDYTCRPTTILVSRETFEEWEKAPNRSVCLIQAEAEDGLCLVRCLPPDELTRFRVFDSLHSSAVAYVEYVRKSALERTVALIEEGQQERLCNHLANTGLFDRKRVLPIAICESVLAAYAQTVGDVVMARRAAQLLHLINLHSKGVNNHGEA